MGTAVFWGMLVATVFGVFLVPGLFAMMEKIGFASKKQKVTSEEVPAAAVSGGGH